MKMLTTMTMPTSPTHSAQDEVRRPPAESYQEERTKHSGLSALMYAATARLCELDRSFSIKDTPTRGVMQNVPDCESNAITTDNSRKEGVNIDEEINMPSSASHTNTAASTPSMAPESHTSSQTEVDATARSSQTISLTTLSPTEESSTFACKPPSTEQGVPLFEETLMTLLQDPLQSNVITFLPDMKFFAIRVKEFSMDALMERFDQKSFLEFCEALAQMGCTRITNDDNDVCIFRHAHFARDMQKRRRERKQEPDIQLDTTITKPSSIDGEDEKPPDRLSRQQLVARISRPDNKNNINEHSMTANETVPSASTTSAVANATSVITTTTSSSKQIISSNNFPTTIACKRRLPQRRDNDSSQKYRTIVDHSNEPPHDHDKPQSRSITPTNTTIQVSPKSQQRHNLALALTSQKLDLPFRNHCKHQKQEKQPQSILAQQAVEDATCIIVADAIDSLLRDEDHTREIFQRHSKALTISVLPGVEAISKQLFETKQNANQQKQKSSKTSNDTISHQQQGGGKIPTLLSPSPTTSTCSKCGENEASEQELSVEELVCNEPSSVITGNSDSM